MPHVDGIAATPLLRTRPRPPVVIVRPPPSMRTSSSCALQAGMLSPAVTRRLIALVAGDGGAAARHAAARHAAARKRVASRLLAKREVDNRVQIALLGHVATGGTGSPRN